MGGPLLPSKSPPLLPAPRVILMTAPQINFLCPLNSLCSIPAPCDFFPLLPEFMQIHLISAGGMGSKCPSRLFSCNMTLNESSRAKRGEEKS